MFIEPTAIEARLQLAAMIKYEMYVFEDQINLQNISWESGIYSSWNAQQQCWKLGKNVAAFDLRK